MSRSSKPFVGLFTQGSLGHNQYNTSLLPLPLSASQHVSSPPHDSAQICSSYIDPMFSGYFLQFHSMFSLYFGWWNLDIECNAHHYMYLVHQNKLMTFCGFGMKTTSFGPPSFRHQGALKKHNLYMHAIAPHHCLSPPTTTVIPVLKLNQIRPHNCSPRISSVSAETDSISRFGDILF